MHKILGSKWQLIRQDREWVCQDNMLKSRAATGVLLAEAAPHAILPLNHSR